MIREYLKHPAVIDIRGEGLLLAVVLKNKELTAEIISRAPDYGLILDYFLFCNDAFRIAPPLTITDDEIQYACDRLTGLIADTWKKIK